MGVGGGGLGPDAQGASRRQGGVGRGRGRVENVVQEEACSGSGQRVPR